MSLFQLEDRWPLDLKALRLQVNKETSSWSKTCSNCHQCRCRGSAGLETLLLTSQVTWITCEEKTRFDNRKSALVVCVCSVRVFTWSLLHQTPAQWWRCWWGRWRRRTRSLRCSTCSAWLVSSHRSGRTSLLTHNHTTTTAKWALRGRWQTGGQT